jgi:hypothetical protein
MTPRLSTAPKAAQIARRRERNSATFLFLTVSTSVALLVIAGAVYLRWQKRPAQQPPLAERRVEPRSADHRSERPSRRVIEPRPEIPRNHRPPLIVEPEPMTNVVSESPAPAPSEPAPAPETPAQPPPIQRADVERLIKALETAKTALSEQNFQFADAELAKAESIAVHPNHRAAVARLKELRGYVKQFADAVAGAAHGLEAGESFKVGTSTQVSFVEAKDDRIVLRIAGMNKTYRFDDLPPGLALALVDFKLPPGDPETKVLKGAYLLVHRRSDSETHAKARELWQQAQASGRDMSLLLPLLTENYADFLKDATE